MFKTFLEAAPVKGYSVYQFQVENLKKEEKKEKKKRTPTPRNITLAFPVHIY